MAKKVKRGGRPLRTRPQLPAPRRPADAPLLSAVMIVKDERENLRTSIPAALELADEVVVYDTGSTDGSQQVAQELGARVVQGYWDDDFGRARTAATQAANGRWYLAVDADEVVVADREALRSLLEGSREPSYQVSIRNSAEDGETGSIHRVTRVVPAGSTWVGRVHERPTGRGGQTLVGSLLPSEVIELEHSGYADPLLGREKGLRNAELARRQLDQLRRGGDVAAIGVTLLDLGRSLSVAADPQGAVDALETLRELVPSGPLFRLGTECLARVLLDAGMPAPVLVLCQSLEADGAPASWTHWLRANALAKLGDATAALAELEHVEELVDFIERRYRASSLEGLRARLTAEADAFALLERARALEASMLAGVADA